MIRNIAGDQFMRSSIQQRTDLEVRLSNKINQRQWQRRIAPVSKGSSNNFKSGF